MIDSYTATGVLAGFLLVFGIIIPILDRIPHVRSFISFRWILVVVYSAMALGVIIDFGHLDTSIRFITILGGIILSAILIIVRSFEKALYNNWHIPHTRARVSKGDVEASLSVCPEIEKIDPTPDIEDALNDSGDKNDRK